MAVIYRGVRTPTGVVVSACRDADPIPLAHSVRHSPDGFEWGFMGSGPMDLAYSILCDFGGAGLANVIYRPFAKTVIATLPHNDWSLTAEQIAEFLVGAAIGEEA